MKLNCIQLIAIIEGTYLDCFLL